MIIPEKSVIYTSTSQMQQICEPLFRATEVIYFEYVRVYNNGRAIKLDTEENVLPYILPNDLYLKPEDIPNFSSHMFMSSQISDFDNISVDVLRDYRNQFNIDNFFFLVENHDQFFEVFVFGGDSNNASIINYFLNNIDKMSQFSLYFLDKGHELIQSALSNSFILKEWRDHFEGENLNSASEKGEFTFTPKVIHFTLPNCCSGQTLSYREFQCLISYLRGLSAKEAGSSLHISPRTVEKHLTNIKKKLGCNDKDAIMLLLKNNCYSKFLSFNWC